MLRPAANAAVGVALALLSLGVSVLAASAAGSPGAALARTQAQSTGGPPGPAPAQVPPAPRIARIGFLSSGTADPDSPFTQAFVQGLRDHGYVEGQNLQVEWRPANGDVARLPALAAELVELQVDVIVAAFTPAILAARDATRTIPIVMPFSGDPVGSGLVASLERPGGNVTGLSNLGPGSQGKRLELLAQLVPEARSFAFVANPLGSNPALAPSLAATRERARSLGLGIIPVEVADPGAFAGALDGVRDAGAGGFILYYNPLTATLRDQVVALAQERRLAAVYETREIALAGGLMAYGPNIADLYRRTGGYVDQLLRGANPAELAVGLPEKYDLVVNLRTAQALGLTIPPAVLEEATEVIR